MMHPTLIRMLGLAALACGLSLPAPSALAQRPTYPAGSEQTLDVDPSGVTCATTPGGCFRIHWTTSGTQAPATTDTTPANGRPDYIDQIAQVVADVYTHEVVNMGWTAPPSDAASTTNGGDGRLDVYVSNVGCGSIASVASEGAVSPGSNSWYSFVVLDRDVRGCYTSPGINSGPGNLATMTQLEVIEDVFAHEYHHVIQNGIRRSARAGFKESTSNWMNDEAYDDLNANVRSSALGDFTLFTAPATSVNSVSYGGWFWLRYLSERFGVNVVRDIWAQLASATGDDLVAINTVLTARGTNLRDAWIDFTGKLYAKDWFREGATYPDINPTGIAATHGVFPVTVQNTTINHMARRYVRFNPQAGVAQRLMQLFVNGPNGQDAGAAVILEMVDGRRVDARMTLDSNNDGSQIVSGFGSAAPPTAAFARVANVVLGLANATQATDALAFSYCSPNCAMVGGPDAMITPWGAEWGNRPPLWQTVDVWVDNDADCQPDTAGRPGCNEPDDPASPAVDAEPSKGRSNALFARVRNLGDTAITGATVTFQYAPFGIGLPPIFANIGTATVNLAAAGSAGDVQVVSVPWDLSTLTFNNGGLWDVSSTPAVETIADFDHFCVKVQITAAGDVNPANNVAQNNFGDIPTAASPRTARFLVGNPFNKGVMAQVRISPLLPRGWSVKLGNVPVGEPFKMKKGEIRLAEATLVGSGDTQELKQDVVVDVSLVVDGVKVSGLSIRLATAPPAGPSGIPAWWLWLLLLILILLVIFVLVRLRGT